MKTGKNKKKKIQRESDKYQDFVVEKLQQIFPNNIVKKEWDSASLEKKDKRPKTIYAPRTDVAVGPFNSFQNIKNGIDNTEEMKNSLLFKRLNERYNIVWNDMSRCALSIEVVFSGSSKHIMGDFLNATSIGAVGIIVCNEQTYSKARRMLNYLTKLEESKRIEKRAMRNLMIFKDVDFKQFLEELSDSDKNKELNIDSEYKISKRLIFYPFTAWEGSDFTDDLNNKLTLYNFKPSKLFRSYNINFLVTDYTYPLIFKFYEFYDEESSKKIKILDIVDIAVKEKFRRRGFGGIILDIIEKIARSNNCDYICVQTVDSASNSPLSTQEYFFRSFGFINNKGYLFENIVLIKKL
ncbi:MAG: GNAT family N-acetyltransferase [Candidatus Pacebacteria bacterium]|nr:GNAT family N-acetyltransferase [Candidatus Paceibacterota bacterium]